MAFPWQWPLSPEAHAPEMLFQVTCPLPLPLVSHRSPFSWGAQLSLPVPAARYDADEQLKALPASGAVLSPGLPGRGGLAARPRDAGGV